MKEASQTRHAFAMLASLAIVATAGNAYAVRSGIDGYTGKNGPTCNDCHKGGPTPNVTLSGPQALTAGQMGQYTVRVETNQPGVGMGGAATDGVTVTPGVNTKQKFAEVAHLSVVAPSNGAAEFTFKVQAPPTNGTITVYAIGNAVDNSKSTSGDAAKTAKLDVTVTGGVTPPPPAVDAGMPSPSGTGSPPGSPPPSGSFDAGVLPSSSTSSDGGVRANDAGAGALPRPLAPAPGSSAVNFGDDGGSIQCASTRVGTRASTAMAGWFALGALSLARVRRIRRRGT